MIQLQTDEDLRAIDGLRVRTAEDDLPIAVCIRKALAQDSLHFHGQGILAIYYSWETKRAASEARKWWKTRLPPPPRTWDGPQGDYDGDIYFRPGSADELPREFFKTVRNPEGCGGFGERQFQAGDAGEEGRPEGTA